MERTYFSLTDYWAWAHSDIMGNAERGKLAEYIVTMAFGVHTGTRTEWDSYDVLTNEGIKIEVKSSGYIQTWVQKKLSNITFGIRATQFWNQENNTYDITIKRQADIYVFCVHNHKEKKGANPLDFSQWDFYVLSARTLDEKVANQKTIILNNLLNLGAIKTNYKGLKNVVNDVYLSMRSAFGE